MKMLVRNWKITLAILMMIGLLYLTQTASAADTVSVKPGNSDTSLIVDVNFSYYRNTSGTTTRTFLFRWRQKTPPGKWKSDKKTYTDSYLWYNPNRLHHGSIRYTIKDLIPGTTYEVRVERGDSSYIREGTTNFTPFLISTTTELTETNLDNATVTLTLNNITNGIYDQDLSYEQDISKIRGALTVSGIDGVTIDTPSLQRISGTEITVELVYDDTDFDTDSVLIFSIDGTIVGDIEEALISEMLVPAVIESVSVSVMSPLTEATLDEGSVTLTLTGTIFEQDISKIREALTVSGIDGVTIDTPSLQRISGTEITVELVYDDTDFDTDSVLIFSIDGTIVGDIEEALISEVPVTAIKEDISASVVSPLTEATLDEGSVTLTLTGATFEQDISKIREALTVSGIDGVTIDTDTMQRISGTEITVELDFDRTDFDTDTVLIFSIDATAIVGDAGKVELTTEIPVTGTKELLSASVVSPLTEATLNGSTVELKITNAVYEQDISKIKEALTVSGINGVTIDTTTLQRLNNRKVTFELKFDGTDLTSDTSLLFNVASGAITNHKGTLTAEILVTANRDDALLAVYWITSRWRRIKIQRTKLDGSNIEDLVTDLDEPRGIALDVSGGKMYWTDTGTDKIQRANLDGSNIQDLVTGLGGPSGIALDVSAGKMYWTDVGTDKIQCANLDGSNVEDLVTRVQEGLVGPSGIALDVSAGKMYWTDVGTDKIQRANLDGSIIEDLVTGLSYPRGIALDVSAGKMYWTDSDTDKIQRANLDGSNIEDLVTGLDIPSGIALDVSAGKMYWTNYQIQRANLDGSNIEDLVSGLGSPIRIAIGLIPSVNQTPIAKEDVNRDGVVDLNDLVIISLRYGQTGNNPADVNGDGTVNVDDLILVAAAIDNAAAAAAAPAARAQVESHFTETQLRGWLAEARLSGNTSRIYQRGIAVIEQLLALFTPEKTALLANYPNPFNPETWIPYRLSQDAVVTLTIYDTQGVVVRGLALGHRQAGFYTDRTKAAYWDGRNNVGEQVASGVYFYTFTADDFTATRKMLIRK